MAQKQTLGPAHFIQSQSMATSFTSAWLDMLEVDNAVIQAFFTGSPTGTFSVMASPDNVNTQTLVLSGTPSVSAAGDVRIELNQIPDRYVRLVYTASSGTGTLDAYITGKGF